jgi:hypothetical protein
MLERIGDLYDNNILSYKSTLVSCFHPEHNPPTMTGFQPGRYRYTCLGCGKITNFEVYPEGVWL